MSSEIKISIITICLNSEKTLRKTIESVLQQKDARIEYIIVDGGSVDSTPDIIASYGDKIDRIIPNIKGVSNAFNEGIKASTGEWIGIINADDWFEKDSFKNLIEFIAENETAEAICGKMRYWKNDHPSYVSESIPQSLDREMTVNHPSTFIKKEVYERLGSYSDEYSHAMDYELMLRLKQNKVEIANAQHIFSNMNDGGLSDAGWIKAIGESRKAKLPYFSSLKVNLYYLRQLSRAFVSRLLVKLNLGSIVAFYRKELSIVKKTKA